MVDRPEIPRDRYKEPVSSGSTREPLELLPEREWLNAKIVDVKFQVAMFNNQIQYVTYKDDNNEDVQVKDADGNPIMREEFEFVFELSDYKLPNGDPRKCWLKLGASFGEKAHLPQFLINVLKTLDGINCPDSIINATKGVEVKLQLKNKQSKDGTKTYQNVVWDAVKALVADIPLEERPVEGPLTEEQQANVDAGIGWDE
jgi:hypothetical protein